MPGAMASLPNILGIGTMGAGFLGNILNSITRGKAIGGLESAEKKYASMTPEQLSGLVRRAEQPLSQDLLENVGNLVQADVATRGLSQSPGVFAAEESQAIAPYKLQEQQNALQLVMKQLGLPIEYAQAILSNTGGGSNLAPLIMAYLLRNANNPTTPSGGQDPFGGEPYNLPDATPPILPNPSASTGGGLD